MSATTWTCDVCGYSWSGLYPQDEYHSCTRVLGSRLSRAESERDALQAEVQRLQAAQRWKATLGTLLMACSDQCMAAMKGNPECDLLRRRLEEAAEALDDLPTAPQEET